VHGPEAGAAFRLASWRPAAHSIDRHRMTAPDETLTPDSSDDLAAELAFALRFQGRKPVEIIARVPHHRRGSRRERMLSPATERKRTKRADTELEAVGDQRALSHCEIKIVVRLPSRRFQAAAADPRRRGEPRRAARRPRSPRDRGSDRATGGGASVRGRPVDTRRAPHSLPRLFAGAAAILPLSGFKL